MRSFFALASSSRCPARWPRLRSVFAIRPDESFLLILCRLTSDAFLGATTRGPSLEDDLIFLQAQVNEQISKGRLREVYFLVVDGFDFFSAPWAMILGLFFSWMMLGVFVGVVTLRVGDS